MPLIILFFLFLVVYALKSVKDSLYAPLIKCNHKVTSDYLQNLNVPKNEKTPDIFITYMFNESKIWATDSYN